MPNGKGGREREGKRRWERGEGAKEIGRRWEEREEENKGGRKQGREEERKGDKRITSYMNIT